MKKFLLIIPIITFFFIISTFFYFLIIERDPSEVPSTLVKKKIPIFETTSLFEKQNFTSTNEFGYETTIVNFFATWCIPCRMEHKYIKKLSSEKAIKVIGINYKDDSQQAIQWLKELGNPYSNIAIDAKGLIAIEWGVYGIPETFIVNQNNIVQYRHVGPITKEDYDKFLKIIENNK